MKLLKRIPEISTKTLGEYYTLLLLVIGLPLIGYLYVDFELALTLTIIIQATIGILYFRKGK